MNCEKHKQERILHCAVCAAERRLASAEADLRDVTRERDRALAGQGGADEKKRADDLNQECADLNQRLLEEMARAQKLVAESNENFEQVRKLEKEMEVVQQRNLGLITECNEHSQRARKAEAELQVAREQIAILLRESQTERERAQCVGAMLQQAHEDLRRITPTAEAEVWRMASGRWQDRAEKAESERDELLKISKVAKEELIFNVQRAEKAEKIIKEALQERDLARHECARERQRTGVAESQLAEGLERLADTEKKLKVLSKDRDFSHDEHVWARMQFRAERAEADLKAARREALAWKSMVERPISTCSACQKEFPATNGAEAMTEHIRECPKHPLAAALQDVARLTDILDREAWLEHARANNVAGPYVPWDTYLAEVRVREEAVAQLERQRSIMQVSIDARNHLLKESCTKEDCFDLRQPCGVCLRCMTARVAQAEKKLDCQTALASCGICLRCVTARLLGEMAALEYQKGRSESFEAAFSNERERCAKMAEERAENSNGDNYIGNELRAFARDIRKES